jgi:SHS2 domain-containing protein
MSRKVKLSRNSFSLLKGLVKVLRFSSSKTRRETMKERRSNNMKKLILIFVFCYPFMRMSQKACNVYGKIKFVDYGEDYKVKFVKYGEDLSIKYVNYGEKKGGTWKVVDYGEDYKLKIVKYGEDFTAKEVDYGEGCN